MPLVSIVVPVFKVDQTALAHCLDSLLAQSERSIEILLVLDGEPITEVEHFLDSICDNTYIHILSIPHSGVSAARNFGITQAKGKWITFVDADDTVPMRALEFLTETAEINNSDIIFGDFVTIMGKKKKSHSYHHVSQTYLGQDIQQILKDSVDPTRAISSVWAKLFSRKFLLENGINFDERLAVGEDTQFVVEAVAHSRSVGYLNKSVYEYRRNKESTVWEFRSDYVKRILTTLNIMRETIETWPNSEKFCDCYRNYILFHLLLIQVHYIFNPGVKWSETQRRAVFISTLDTPIFKNSLAKMDFKSFSAAKRISLLSLHCRLYWFSGQIAKIRQNQIN